VAYDAFISYSTQDKLTADAVCGILESQGIRCWIAPRDIALGADWTESLVEAIEQCPVLVLVFSKHANESHQIKREVNLAIDNGRTVIPVRVEDVMPSKSLKFSININHWLDAFPPPLENHLQRLAASIRTHLKMGPEKGEVLGGALAPAASKEVFVPEKVAHEPDREVSPALTPLSEPEPEPEPIVSYPPQLPVTPTPSPAPVAKAPTTSLPPAFTPPSTKNFASPPVKQAPEATGTSPGAQKPFPFMVLVMGAVWTFVFIIVVFILIGGVGIPVALGLPLLLAAIGGGIYLSVKGKLPGTRR
jgi:hypothetical protein